MIIAAVVLAAVVSPGLASQAQQPSSPQPSAPCTQPCDPTFPLQPPPYTMPCSAPVAPQPPKGWKFKLPKKAQQLFDKQRQQIEQQTGITTPSADELTKQLQQQQPPKLRPCPFSDWYKPEPAPKSNP